MDLVTYEISYYLQTDVFEVDNGLVSIEQRLEDIGLNCDGVIIPVLLCFCLHHPL